MCLRTSKNLTFSILIFHPNYHPYMYTICNRKAPNFAHIGCFYDKFLQIHQIYEFGLLCLWWNPPIAVSNFTKKHLKRQALIRVSCQCETPRSRQWGRRDRIKFLTSQIRRKLKSCNKSALSSPYCPLTGTSTQTERVTSQ